MDALPELKKPLTYAEQVNHLISVHHLKIDNKQFAMQVLSEVNYYRLSAYGIGLGRKDDRDFYQDGITIEHLYRLYSFDSSFKNITVHLIEQVEIQLRTQIAYYLALTYGAEGYLDHRNFQKKYRHDGKDIFDSVIESFNQECVRQKRVPF